MNHATINYFDKSGSDICSTFNCKIHYKMRDFDIPILPYKIKAADFLAGGGGVTTAMCKIPDVSVRFVLNHDQLAIRTNY